MPQAPAGTAKPQLTFVPLSRALYVHTLHRRPHQHARRMIEPARACVRARARVLCAVRCALHVHVPFTWCSLLVAAGARLPADPCCVLLPEMAAYPALRIQRTGPVSWRGRRSDSGRCSGLAHQPARAVACLGAVAAFLLPIFSSICIPLLECEPSSSSRCSRQLHSLFSYGSKKNPRINRCIILDQTDPAPS